MHYVNQRSYHYLGLLQNVYNMNNYFCSEEELYFEQPVQTAMLLSMTGVGCVVANQLYMSVETNLRHTKVLLKGIVLHTLIN